VEKEEVRKMVKDRFWMDSYFGFGIVFLDALIHISLPPVFLTVTE